MLKNHKNKITSNESVKGHQSIRNDKIDFWFIDSRKLRHEPEKVSWDGMTDSTPEISCQVQICLSNYGFHISSQPKYSDPTKLVF